MSTESTSEATGPDRPSSFFRYANSQRDRTLVHPIIRQQMGGGKGQREHEGGGNDEDDANAGRGDGVSHSFVVCADTQLGMTSLNTEWETELEYSRCAIRQINELAERGGCRPLFCCVCGDLVDMTSRIYATKDGGKDGKRSEEECDRIQDEQNRDFQDVWKTLHPDIALVCICGNHDVGNTPTQSSMRRFRNAFGDDYLSFWAKDTYNIVLNTALFSDPSLCQEQYNEQLRWLEDQLQYARGEKRRSSSAADPDNDHDVGRRASHVFVFGHHPWFLYDEDETVQDLEGKYSPYPGDWNMAEPGIADSYFTIPLERRREAMELFKRYDVTALFAGHFHQNHVAKASNGMPLIVTSSLSVLLHSNGIPPDSPQLPNSRGFRVVTVKNLPGQFKHKFHRI